MRIVVTDTSPVNYLIQMGCVDVLGALFESVVVPEAVMRELRHPSSPQSVQQWAAHPPSWTKVRACQNMPSGLGLDPGETEAIGLALELGIEMVVMDERKGRRTAAQLGLSTIGTLALLELGDENGLLDFEPALERLRRCNFRISEELVLMAQQRIQKRRKST